MKSRPALPIMFHSPWMALTVSLMMKYTVNPLLGYIERMPTWDVENEVTLFGQSDGVDSTLALLLQHVSCFGIHDSAVLSLFPFRNHLKSMEIRGGSKAGSQVPGQPGQAG